MKTEHKIKMLLKTIGVTLKSCISAAGSLLSKLIDIDGFENYNAKNLKYNNYENYRIEISLQMLRNRSMF